MSPRFDRLHVTLALLLALGVGYRWHASRRPGRSPERARVQEQLRRLGRAGRHEPRAVATRRARKGVAPAATTDGVRREQSPVGAVPPSPRPVAEKPPGRPERVDLDAASADALEALPGIGPALARRLVTDRANHGPFGSLDGLVRVKGVGPRLVERLAPYVTFGGGGRPSSVISIPASPAGEGPLSGSRRSGRHRQ